MRDLKHQLKIDKNFPTLCFATKVNEIFLKIFITEKIIFLTLEFLLCDKINE